jgi:hypothetical protein
MRLLAVTPSAPQTSSAKQCSSLRTNPCRTHSSARSVAYSTPMPEPEPRQHNIRKESRTTTVSDGLRVSEPSTRFRRSRDPRKNPSQGKC